MVEQKIEIKDVGEIKTSTAIRKLIVKGEEVDRQLVTRVQFEGQLDPADIAQIHRLLKSGHDVNVSIWSPQLSMNLVEK